MGTFAINGVAYDGWWQGSYSSLESRQTLDQIVDLRADSISIKGNAVSIATPTSYEVTIDPDRFAEEREAVIDAQQRGLSILLKPHLAVGDGSWSGDARPADMAQFFAGYKTMLLQYAALAQEFNLASLSVGNEIDALTGPAYRDYWVDIIGSVRSVYSGELTYASGYNLTASTVSFADQLDYIGINAYVPLATTADPTYDQIVKGWTEPPVNAADRALFHGLSAVDYYHQLSTTLGKPVVFTEIGYNSGSRAAISPGDSSNAGTPDQALQADLYKALFDVWGAESDWMHGAYLWNVDPYADPAAENPNFATSMDPRGKLAQSVIEDAYGAPGLLAPAASGLVSTITIRVSGLSWNGNPETVLVVDRKLVSFDSISADIMAGDVQEITVHGQFGPDGPSQVQLYYTNDEYEGPGMDRNAYVHSLTVNGQTWLGSQGISTADLGYTDPEIGYLLFNGHITFDVRGAAPLPDADAAPVFDLSQSTLAASIEETVGTTGAAAPLAASGTLAFTDQDVSDLHSVTAALARAVWSGGGVFPAAAQDAVAAALAASVNDATGTVSWTFNLAEALVDFLAEEDTLSLTYRVTLDDGAGGTASQDVAVTLVGHDDGPVVAADAGSHVRSEMASTTGSGSMAQLQGTLAFSDPDLNDAHTATAAFEGAAWSNGEPAPDATLAALASALTASVAADTTIGGIGSAAWTVRTGSLSWSFGLADGLLDFLAAGQTLTATYAVGVDDGHGGTASQPVAIVLTGANDRPVLAPATPLVVSETVGVTGGSGQIGGASSLTFSDADLTDTHSATAAFVRTTWSKPGTVPSAAQAAMAAGLSVAFMTDSTGGGTGELAWTFAAADKAFDFLALGETLTGTYNVTVSDGLGGTSVQPLTVTLAGADDRAILAADTLPHKVSEVAGVTNGASTLRSSGALAFTDADVNDKHNVSAALTGWSRPGGLPYASLNSLTNAMSAALAADSTGGKTGSVSWSFAAPDKAFDFLSAGETLALTYTLSVSNGQGGVGTGTVTVTATGANDGPVLAADTLATHSLAEAAGVAGSASLDTTSGFLTFTDADWPDTHAVRIALASSAWSKAGTIPSATQTALASALTASIAAESTGGQAGQVGWTFTIADKALDFLAAGETLTETYNLTLDDGRGGTSVKPVKIVLNGANDIPVAVNDFAGVKAGAKVSGAVLANDSDPDLHDSLGLTSVQFGATSAAITAPKAASIKGAYGTLSLSADGSYTYTETTPSNSLPSTVGQDVFTYKVSDAHGGITTATLAVTAVHSDQTYLGGAAGATLRAGTSKTVLDGENGGMTLIGGSAADVLIGGPGATMTGGAGADTFLFHQKFGRDTVTDFNPVADTIQFDKALFSTYTAVTSHAEQVGGDVVITSDAGDALTLKNVLLSNLQSSDFLLA
jgi:VCBS repeat-containing protein